MCKIVFNRFCPLFLKDCPFKFVVVLFYQLLLLLLFCFGWESGVRMSIKKKKDKCCNLVLVLWLRIVKSSWWQLQYIHVLLALWCVYCIKFDLQFCNVNIVLIWSFHYGVKCFVNIVDCVQFLCVFSCCCCNFVVVAVVLVLFP